MSARLAACGLLLLACGQWAEAAAPCHALVAREGDVTLRCEGFAPGWRQLGADAASVELRGLRLHRLGAGFLAGHALPTVTHLYLPHNQIRTVLDNATVGLPSLVTLDLSHNRLERLEAGALAGSPRLQTLVLSHNHLLALPGHHWDFLLPLTQLQHLQIRHCSLWSVPEAALKALSAASRSAELDVRGNPSAAAHCRRLAARMREDSGAPRLLCDALRSTAPRPPPALEVALWCVAALVCAALVLAALWRWRYGKNAATALPYRHFFLHARADV